MINCPVTGCELLEKDCKTPYKGLALSMSKVFPFNLLVGIKATLLKEEPTCIKCKNAYMDLTYDKLVVIQTGSCKDVLTSKTIDQKLFDSKKLEWKKEPTKVTIDNAESFFNNRRESICPITKCTLMKEDCKTKNTNKNVKISDKWPYEITTDQQSILGYETGFCLECWVGDQKTQSKPFKLTQTSKCLTTLSASKSPFSMKYIDFSPLVLDKHNLGNTYKEFFDNKDTKNCPVDKCEVL